MTKGWWALIYTITRKFYLCFFLFLCVPASVFAGIEDSGSMSSVQSTDWDGVIEDVAQRFPEYAHERLVIVSVKDQSLAFILNGKVQSRYPVSTSKYGIGSTVNSNRTPLGVHRIKRKFGEGAQVGAVFKARVATGQIAPIVTQARTTPQDFVTTRILWLDGLEPGKNKGAGVDSFKRYIYIHGTDEEGLIGQPASKGCVRMLNRDVVELFDSLPLDTLVVITE